MRAVLMNMVFLCLFWASVSAIAAPLSKKTEAAPNEPGKYTVCSVTINSSNEIDTFKKVLGTKKFNYVELTSYKYRDDEEQPDESTAMRPEWLELSCKKQIRCDILVVSGHFGGKFFSEKPNGLELDLDDLEIASCNQGCRATIQAPKEVFLFGCNTMAGKDKSFRTPEQYRAALLSHDFDAETAEQMVAFRYSQFGDSFASRMMGVFKNSPRIYGFNDSAPKGKNVQHYLTEYLKKVEATGYYSQGKFLTAGDATNMPLKSAMRETTMVQGTGLGEQKYHSAVCYLHDPKISMNAKHQFIDEALMGTNMLAHLPFINSFMTKNMRNSRSDEVVDWDDKTFEKFENVSKYAKAKAVMDDMIARNFDAILSMQMNALKFQRTMGWINERAMNKRAIQLLLGNETTKWTQTRFDTVRSILPGELTLDMPLRELPLSKFNDPFFVSILRELKIVNPEIILKLIEVSEDSRLSIPHRDNALKSIFTNLDTREAVDYAVKLISRGEGDGLIRMDSIGAYFRFSERGGAPVSKALNEVIDDKSIPIRKRSSALYLYPSQSDEDARNMSVKAVAMLHELLSVYRAQGSVAGFDTPTLCRQLSRHSGNSGKYILTREERDTVVKIGLSCPKESERSVFQLLKRQPDLEKDIVEAVLIRSLESGSGSNWSQGTSFGPTWDDKLLDIRKYSRLSRLALDKMKTVPQGNRNSTLMQFALGSEEGQAYLLELANKPEYTSMNAGLMTVVALSDANRTKVVERALQNKKDGDQPGQLLAAIMLTPSLADRYLRTAMESMNYGFSLSSRDMESKFADLAGAEEFLPKVIKLALDPTVTAKGRQVAAGLIAYSRPKTQGMLEALRKLHRDKSLPKEVRDCAAMSLFGVDDPSVGVNDVADVELAGKYSMLQKTKHKDILPAMAKEALESSQSFMAISFLVSNNRDEKDPTDIRKFLEYQLTHHDRTKDFSPAELMTLRMLKANVEPAGLTGLFQSLQKFVRLDDMKSTENLRLAALLAEGNPVLMKFFANFVRTGTWEELKAVYTEIYRDDTLAGLIADAMIERLQTATTEEQIDVIRLGIEPKKLSLVQIVKVRDFHARQKDVKLIRAARSLWPRDNTDF